MANSFVLLADLKTGHCSSPLRYDFSDHHETGVITAELCPSMIQCRCQQKILNVRFSRPVLESGDRDRLWEFRLLASVERKKRDDGVDGGICKEAIPGAAGETKGF
ncbi:hypothetical protein F2Q70_00043396 [Brassica cretica]|uniref:Uncharacterized protein n=1 Tax=Brassica cretica TaxID=69181 RepID=A0A8S9KJC9_BRACR|nr:hypothetical protein F2Q70_00043396 [Brassica cretica]